jgi:hypothetical protein
MPLNTNFLVTATGYNEQFISAAALDGDIPAERASKHAKWKFKGEDMDAIVAGLNARAERNRSKIEAMARRKAAAANGQHDPDLAAIGKRLGILEDIVERLDADAIPGTIAATDLHTRIERLEHVITTVPTGKALDQLSGVVAGLREDLMNVIDGARVAGPENPVINGLTKRMEAIDQRIAQHATESVKRDQTMERRATALEQMTSRQDDAIGGHLIRLDDHYSRIRALEDDNRNKQRDRLISTLQEESKRQSATIAALKDDLTRACATMAVLSADLAEFRQDSK